jgi:pyruvate formate lyase activating enzyme
MAKGLVFNIQQYSIQDGPGIRTTVFLKGCPLNCAWCHNPEGISARPEILLVESRCIGCFECRSACPQGSTIEGTGVLPARNASCIMCGACVEACPTGARQMVGRRMTVDEVLSAVLKDRVFYESSGGGVTFSGGEPLAQFEFVYRALSACRAAGIHTAVDTCGLGPTDHLLKLATVTDLFLYDIKMMNPEKHVQHTCASNELILENLRGLGSIHPQIWVRVPVIPGINDSTFELQSIAEFAASVPGVRQVNLLPFHRIGIPKANRLGQSSGVVDIEPPSQEAMEAAVDIFRSLDLVSRSGGF